MAADTAISEFQGAAPGTPASIDGLTIRFKRADNSTQDANDPVPIPSSGYEYSWRKSLKLRVPTTGPDNEIRNLRFYSEGQSLGIDREILILKDATYTQGSSGDESAAISAVNVDTYTIGSPLTIEAGQVFAAAETGNGTQDFVELQARIGPTATAGNSSAAKGLVYRYDET